ncbi:MAG: hypothetical protein ACLQU3_21715 [Limisphaerales bacterium]
MKTSIALVLSCASVLATDTGVRVITTSTINAETASVSIKDVFTRDGQTNLVRKTTTKAGTVQIRVHHFYHGGHLVGDFIAHSGNSGFITEAGSPYSVGFEFGPSNEVRSAMISTKDGVVLDMFTCTNGEFSPSESSVIQKANAIKARTRQLFDAKHLRETSPEDFVQEAEDLLQKHQQE